jgi:hypothetical protein
MSKDIKDTVPQSSKLRSMGKPRVTPAGFKIGSSTKFVDVFDLRDDSYRTMIGISIFNPGSYDMILSIGKAFSEHRDIVVPSQQFSTFDNITFGDGASDNASDENLSHIRAKMGTDEGTFATATIDYSGSGQPANGQLVNIGPYVYEFSSDENVNDGNTYVEIGVSADDSWTNLVNAINVKDQAVTASIDTGLDVVTITSNYGGDYGNGYVVADGASPTGAVFSGNLAGGIGGVAAVVHVW